MVFKPRGTPVLHWTNIFISYIDFLKVKQFSLLSVITPQGYIYENEVNGDDKK